MHLRLFIALCLCSAALAIKVTSNETSPLDAKERARRLIPYMAVYLTTPVSPAAQGIAAQYRPHTKNSWPYPGPQSPQPQHYAVPVHLVQAAQVVPSGYLDSPLTKTIGQNYLAIAKQIGSKSALDAHQPVSFAHVQDGESQVKQYHQEVYNEPIGRFQPLQPVYSNIPQQYTQTPTYHQYTGQSKIKQHLTEIRPITKTSYDPQIHDLATLNYEKNPGSQQIFVLPSNKQYAQPTTEQTVTITQSQELDLPFNQNKYQPSSYKTNPLDIPVSYKEHREHYDDNSSSEESSEENLGSSEEGIDGNINDILQGASLSIPNKITPDNLDSSIKALSKLLKILQQANTLPHSAKKIVKTFPRPVQPGSQLIKLNKIPARRPVSSYDDDKGGTPGRAGVDYPNYDEIPPTKFNCAQQRYKGFFGDPDTGCQVWHYCDLNGGQASFLCPNGTIFSQAALTCDWWFNVKCSSTKQQYVLNERLYKFILPHKPTFPEDYAGPEVDHYLSLKFREIERNKTLTQDSSEEKSSESTSSESSEEMTKLTDINRPYSLDDVESENRVRSIAP